ncbi:MAG: hypothetical protein HY332_01685 [Chloroflexi bacterium]|nr:hypothetical protein [Chloroflexota bacterium]
MNDYLDLDDTVRRLVLFGTNQPSSTLSRYRANDTIWCAKVLARYLQARRGVGDAKAVAIDVEGVHLYDVLYDFFGRALRHPPIREMLVTKCYVAMAGGTPAANSGLLLRAVERFGAAVQALHKGESHAAATPIRIGAQIVQQTQRAAVLTFVTDGYFGPAGVMLRGWASLEADYFGEAAAALQLRLNFDVEGARRRAAAALVDAQRLGAPTAASQLQRLVAELQHLVGPPAMLKELYWSAALCREQGRLLDFVTRAASLAEQSLRHVTEESLGLPADDRNYERVRATVAARPQLLDAVKKHSRRSEDCATEVRALGIT